MTRTSHANDLKGRRLLVVEDAFLIADMISAILESCGAEVVGPAGNLESAVSLARAEALDGALLDVDLGGINSGPVADVLRARDIPFLFLTGHCSAEALPCNFRDTPRVLKPFREDELERTVAQCLRAASGAQGADGQASRLTSA